jgi:nucleoid-associated protein YgaU
MRLKASDPAPTVAFEGRPVTPPPAPPDDPAVEEAADPRSTVVVRRGDNLWDISATRLERRWGRKPADHEIAPYWRRVMETNRPRLRSGDPNLIYPGEVVELPPLD